MSGERDQGGTHVVVGVDGSRPSKAALRWAVRYAALTHGVVDAVIAWDYPVNYEWAPVMDGQEFQDAAAATLDDAVHDIVGDDTSVKVTTALLGSASERCVRHALCPVVVVHAPAA